MSDTAKTQAQRRREIEERRAERWRAIKERNDEQRLDVEDIIDERGIDPLEVVVVPTNKGVVACQKATLAELNRFKRAVNSEAMESNRRARRANKVTDPDDATKALVRSAVIYPSEEEFEALMLEYPMVWETLAEGLVDLGGAAFEADVRKN